MNDTPPTAPDALDAFGRPLLILPNDEVVVELDGTERLVLRTHDGNVRHAVPLRHVRSITANPHVTFTGAALDACARRGIAITFVDGRQKRRAFFFPLATNPLQIATLLSFALDDPDWPERYGAWYENHRLGALSRVALACGLLPDAALRRAPDIALEASHRRKHGQPGHEWIAALREIVLTEFMADGSRWLGTQGSAWRAETWMHLLEELGEIVALHAHAVFHLAHKPLQHPPQRWALAAYHAERTRWQNETVRLLYAFEHFIRENWT